MQFNILVIFISNGVHDGGIIFYQIQNNSNIKYMLKEYGLQKYSLHLILLSNIHFFTKRFETGILQINREFSNGNILS